jgi:hypothetical protein
MTENYFLNAIGEIVLRMGQNHGIYGLGLPKSKTYLKKIRKIPKRVLKMLNLRFLMVNRSGIVNEITYRNI